MLPVSRSLTVFSTVFAALALPLAATGVHAQVAPFAVELSPPLDYYTPMRVGVRVQGVAVENAATFVRGCTGYLVPEGAPAVFDVTARLESLAFTASGESLVSMVLGTPDGLYRCALVGADGLASTQFSNVGAGRYLVWLGASEGTEISARLIASDQPISALELNGLDVASLGEPRAGRHIFTATAEAGRQQLVAGGVLYPEHEMRPLNTEYCPGYSRFDAADVVLTLDAREQMMSVFALSDRDLTLAVRAPDGTVLCNDDSLNLNPAVTFQNAAAGDYHVFVGGYSQGGTGIYDLFASQGAPAFSDATLDLNAPPRMGQALLDTSLARDGQLLAEGQIVANDPFEMLPIGNYCPGYTGIDAPDLVLTLGESHSLLSLYAMSQTDMVMAVRAPGGQWQCNDDSFGLNPGVQFSNAAPGDYHIFVGAYSQGAGGMYNLYAALGQPNWQGAQGGASGAGLNADAEPAVGRVSFGPQTRVDPRVIFDVVPSRNEAFGLGDGCAGYIDPSRPDLVIAAEPGLPQLMIYMVSEADGTLLIVGPDGRVHCNDDFEGLNPGVMIPNPQAGDYAVFAGTYGGSGGVATLGATIASPLWVMDREH